MRILQKFEAIEGLRGWMAWWVVLGHALHVSGAGEFLPQTVAGLLTGGEMAVQVFMIVSGFVIAHLLMTKRQTYSKYIALRYFRIAPLFLVATAAAILTRDLYEVAYIDNPWAFDSAMRADRMIEEARNWLAHSILHISMMHGVVPDSILPYSSTTFLAPGWSLSLEWQFYILAPLLVAGMMHLNKSIFVFIVLALSLLSLQFSWRMPSFLPESMLFFSIGIASRMAISKRIGFVAVAAILASLLLHIYDLEAWEIRNLILVIIIWATFLLISVREAGIWIFNSAILDRFSKLIALNPFLIAVGRVSYSTYLVHIVLFAIIIGGGIRLTGSTDRSTVLLLTALAVVATLPASFLLYRYVERPGIRLGNHLLWLADRRGPRVSASGNVG